MRPATVLLVASLLGAASGNATPLLVLPDNREGWPFGICVHQLVQQTGPATQALDDLGAPWVRIDINWNEVEPQQGTFDWTLVDKMVATARARGYVIYATLAYTPKWATAGGVRSGVPSAASHYGDFVAAVVKRHKDQVKHWGLWNEPEQSHFWEGTPKQLVDLVLKPGADAIHTADALARVLGPDSGSHDWLVEIFKEGGGAYLDVITVHVYACCDSSDGPAKVLWRLDCTGGWPWDPCLRNAIVDGGQGSKPVWLTEVGWKTLTPDWEAKQASYYTGLLDEMLLRPWWKKTIFYELYDASACDPAVDNCWGIVRPDWSRKPAFDVLKSYIVNHQPRAEAGPGLQGAAGVPVAFDGSGSHDPDGTIVAHRWDFDRGDGVSEEATGAKTSHVYSKPGAYVATLVVTDNHGLEDADTVAVTVGPAPPPSDARPDAIAPDAAGDRSPAVAADGPRLGDHAVDGPPVATAASGCACALPDRPARPAALVPFFVVAILGLSLRSRRR